MDSFFSRYKNLLVLILVLLAQVVGLAVQVRRPAALATGDDKGVRVLRYWVVSLVAPPEAALHWFGSGIRGMWTSYIYLRGVRQQNRDLKDEVERLRIEQSGLIEDARQGERLQKLLDFKRDYIYQTVIAQVIGTSGTDQSRVIYIDKGSREGIKPDMPVITPDGIVGKVKDVFPNTSQVLEVSDQTSGAGVLLEATRIRGILRGNVYGQPQVVNVMPDDRIKPGEKVLTSGGDQVFPRGLPVGTVDHVVTDPEHEPYIAVLVQPAANLSRLEEVMVITSTGSQMPKQEQEDLAISAVDGASARQRAAAALSAGLPSATDPNATNSDGSAANAGKTPDGQAPTTAAAAQAQAAALKQSQTGIPVPTRTLPPLHPDRFTPLTVLPASELVPGQAPPHTTPYPRASSDSESTTAPVSRAAGTKPSQPVAATLDANGDPVTPAAKPKPKPIVLDENGNPVKPVIKPKSATSAALDLDGNPIKPIVKPRPVTPLTLDLNGNLIKPVVKPKTITPTAFDANGNPIKPIVKPRPVTPLAFDANGNPIRPVAKPKTITPTAFDANGNPIKPIVKPKAITPTAFDANGNPIKPKPKPKTVAPSATGDSPHPSGAVR